MIIDKTKDAEEILNKYSEFIGKGFEGYCKGVYIKSFDINNSVAELGLKDGITCVLDLKNMINIIVGKEPYKEPLQFDDNLKDNVYAMCKIAEAIRGIAFVVNMIAEGTSNLDKIHKLLDREKFIYKGPFKIVQENKRIFIS